MGNLGLTILIYLVAYIIVALLDTIHAKLSSRGRGDAKTKTKGRTKNTTTTLARMSVLRPVYSLIIFMVGAFILFSKISPVNLETALTAALIWEILTIIIDFVFHVLIKRRNGSGARSFYTDSQPWLILSYLAIYASPLLVCGIMNLIAG